MIVVLRQGHLFEIVAALRSPCGFARRLDGGEQECDQDGDDGDHHQEFDEREPGLSLVWHNRPLFGKSSMTPPLAPDQRRIEAETLAPPLTSQELYQMC